MRERNCSTQIAQPRSRHMMFLSQRKPDWVDLLKRFGERLWRRGGAPIPGAGR